MVDFFSHFLHKLSIQCNIVCVCRGLVVIKNEKSVVNKTICLDMPFMDTEKLRSKIPYKVSNQIGPDRICPFK